MSSWIFTGIGAMLCFFAANFFIAELSDLGVQSVYYFNSGSLIFCIGFFLAKREWNELNPPGPAPPADDINARKVLLRKWQTNKFDYWSLFICILSAFL